MTSRLLVDKIEGKTTSGTIQMPAGMITQIVQEQSSARYTTTSTSYADIGLSASITPKFSTSKVLILCAIACEVRGGNQYYVSGRAKIQRGSTDVFTSEMLGADRATINSGSSASSANHFLQHLDSPSTTSATTYKVQGLSTASGYTVNFCGDYANHSISTITLMEVSQ